MFQRDRVIKYIREHGSITSWQAYQELGVTQLATRIFELKERGYAFKKVRHFNKSRFGRPSHYDEYFLDEHEHEEEGHLTESQTVSQGA